jgi:hypothetical protein
MKHQSSGSLGVKEKLPSESGIGLTLTHRKDVRVSSEWVSRVICTLNQVVLLRLLTTDGRHIFACSAREIGD